MKIDFSFETKHGTFADALHFDDNAVPDDATIEAMKQERVNNWIWHLDNPKPPPPSKYKRDQNNRLILDENGDPIPLEA